MNKNYFTESLNQSHQQNFIISIASKPHRSTPPPKSIVANHQNPETFTPTTEAMVPVTRTYSRCQNSRSLRTPPWLSGAREIPAPGFLRPVGCQRRFFWAEAPDAKKDGSRSRGLLRKDFPNWHWKKTYLGPSKGCQSVAKVNSTSVRGLIGTSSKVLVFKKNMFPLQPKRITFHRTLELWGV